VPDIAVLATNIHSTGKCHSAVDNRGFYMIAGDNPGIYGQPHIDF
jgi:hypothetical protein